MRQWFLHPAPRCGAWMPSSAARCLLPRCLQLAGSSAGSETRASSGGSNSSATTPSSSSTSGGGGSSTSTSGGRRERGACCSASAGGSRAGTEAGRAPCGHRASGALPCCSSVWPSGSRSARSSTSASSSSRQDSTSRSPASRRALRADRCHCTSVAQRLASSVPRTSKSALERKGLRLRRRQPPQLGLGDSQGSCRTACCSRPFRSSRRPHQQPVSRIWSSLLA